MKIFAATFALLALVMPARAQDEGAPMGEAPAESAPPAEGESYSAEEMTSDQSAPVAAPVESAEAPAESAVPAPASEPKKTAKKGAGKKSAAKTAKTPALPPATKAGGEGVAAVPLTPVGPFNP